MAISLDYDFVGFSLGFSPKFLSANNDDRLKGKSSFTNYQFRFFLGNWTQGLQYSNVQGYYVENTNDFIPGWIRGEDSYIQFPDLKVIKWGGTTSYVFNPKFSLRNVVYQTEWQQKSAGSFIPELKYSYNRFSNRMDNIKTVENAIDIQLASSYYYTWVIDRNWFISPFLSPSLGVRLSNTNEKGSEIDINEKNQYFINALEGGLQLGYSSRKVIFGANINFNANWYNEDKTTTIVNDKVYAKLYIGYRLNAPKEVEKPFKWMKKKLGL